MEKGPRGTLRMDSSHIKINDLAGCVIQSNSTIYRTGGLDLMIPTSSENLGAQIGLIPAPGLNGELIIPEWI
ncbi:60S Ribosomal Protein L9 [Manis pentadactyla]|nr:60S Ribosomal Protein L9 [Manis pentadactyla]